MIVTRDELVQRYSQEKTDALVALYLGGTLTEDAHSAIIAELATRDIGTYALYQVSCLSNLANKKSSLRSKVKTLKDQISGLENEKKQAETELTEAIATRKGVEDGSISDFELSDLAKNGLMPLTILSFIVVVVGILDWPYGYYMFVRLVLCGSAVYGAYLLPIKGSIAFWLMILLAILYNPIFPVHLGDKKLWFVINVATLAIFFWVSWVQRREKTKLD